MNTTWEPALSDPATQAVRIAKTVTNERFEPLAAELDEMQRYPLESLPALRESGFFSMFVPREYGGSELPLEAIVGVVEAIAKGCASTSAILAALSLGAYPLVLKGSAAQKQRYLRDMAEQGEAICFALSEMNAGSDAAAIQTTATCDGDNWHIQGEKCWLGNGEHSSRYIVFAKTEPDDPRSISAFVVERKDPGVVVDHYEDKLGIRGTTTTNLKLDTRVAQEAMVGEVGDGLSLALETLTLGRLVIAAQANGIASAALEDAVSFSKERTAFGKAIIKHQGVGFQLADSAVELTASRMFMYQVAKEYDNGNSIRNLAPMAKLFASETSHRVVDRGMQVLGGRGYVKPHRMERLYRDQRITEIYEGTSEIQRMVIARAIGSDADSRTSS